MKSILSGISQTVVSTLRTSWSLWAVLLILLVQLIMMNNIVEWRSADCPLHFDQHGYYLYLPATFVERDLCELRFYAIRQQQYHIAPQSCQWGIFAHPQTGCKYNKYPVGVALLEAPLFLILHAWVTVSHKYPADG